MGEERGKQRMEKGQQIHNFLVQKHKKKQKQKGRLQGIHGYKKAGLWQTGKGLSFKAVV